MFRMMVTPWRDASPYLGVGKYYVRAEGGTESRPEASVNVTLKAPLILNERQVRMLVQKYGTDSSDSMTALAGAWTLRREILQMGHDGIIAVGSPPDKSRMTLVELARAPNMPPSGSPNPRDRKSGADICRLISTEIVGAY